MKINRVNPFARAAVAVWAPVLIAASAVVATASPSGAAPGDYSEVQAGWNVRSSANGAVVGVSKAGWYQTFCYTDAGGYRWFRDNYNTSNGFKTNAYIATVGIPKQASLPRC